MVELASCFASGGRKSQAPARSLLISVTHVQTANGFLFRWGKGWTPLKDVPKNSSAPPLRLKQTATKAPSSELSISTKLRNQRMTERRLQLGRSVDALREYFPHLLVTPWPQELLSDEVVLKETISPHFGLKPFNAYGKRNYNRRMWFVRLYASLFCRETKVRRIIIVIGTGPYLMCCVGRLSGAGNAVLAAEQRDRHHSMEHEISPTRLSQHLRHDFADGWRFGDQTGSPRTYLSASGGCDRPTQSQV